MSSVRKGTLRLLIATDVAARGIDIEQIDLVVNYAIHDTAETYVHRTGRTGRAGRKGTALSLVGPQDFGPFINLKRGLSYEIKKTELPTAKDVHEAKIAHFHELLDAADMMITDRDLALGKTLLQELSGMAEQERAAEVMAKFYRIVLQAAVKHSAEAETEAPQSGSVATTASQEAGPRPRETGDDSHERNYSRGDRNVSRPRRDREGRGRDGGGRSYGRSSRGGGRGRR